ncbi:MAG: T9SS type B sorting domain-containing protein, partial [Sphingobacteriales bacterium]
LLNSNGDNGADPGFGGDIFLAKYDTLGNYIWAFNIGSSSINDLGVAVATDANDNVYLGGYFRGSPDFDPGAGTYSLNETSGTTFLAKYTATGQLNWAFNFGGGSIDNSIWEVRLDNSGFVYISAFFQGSNIDMDPSASTTLISSNGQADIVIGKYNSSDGSLVWAQKIGGSGWDRPFGLTVDGAGSVYVGGYFNSTSIDLDPGPGVVMANGTGNSKGFLVKLSNNGTYQWSVTLEGTATTSYFESLEIDEAGNVVGIGIFNNTVDFDPSPASANVSSAGGIDGFVAKYSATGSFLCVGRIGGGANDAINDVEIAGADFILVGQFASATADLDPGPGVSNNTNTGQDDGFISKIAWSTVAAAGALSGSSVCAGQTGQLTFNATSGNGPYILTISNGSTTVTYNNITSGIPFTPIPVPSGNTTYTLTSIKDANTCSSVVPANSTTNISFITVTPAVSGTNNICAGESTQLNASGGNSYSWSPGTGLSASNIANPIASPASTTTYTVTVTGTGGCTATATITVTVRAKPVVTLSAPTAICAGDSTQLTATGGGTYAWTPASGLSNPAISNPKASPASTTTYQALVTGANGCKDSASVTIGVNNRPVVTITPNSSICVGDSLQLNATGGGIYQWSPSAGLSNSTIASPKASPATTTIYQALVTNASGCKDSARTTVTVAARPLVNLGPDTLLCTAAPLTLNATTAGATSYNWSTGGTTPTINVSTAGTYSVAVQVPGCLSPSRDTIVVTTGSLPTVTLGPDRKICATENTELSFQGTAYTSFVWSNGNTSPTIMVNTAGTYWVRVQNQCGNAADTLVLQTENCADDIYFPSAFTPNQDGRNEGFKALHAPGVVVYDYKLTIYNRWGNRVFHTNYLEAAWGGTIEGARQGINTFVFYAEYRRTLGGELIKKKGTFVQIR